jgi:hypothetical protein
VPCLIKHIYNALNQAEGNDAGNESWQRRMLSIHPLRLQNVQSFMARAKNNVTGIQDVVTADWIRVASSRYDRPTPGKRPVERNSQLQFGVHSFCIGAHGLAGFGLKIGVVAIVCGNSLFVFASGRLCIGAGDYAR